MARTANYVKLDTKTARQRLAPRGEPYYTQIATGLTLGYKRRSSGPGRWVRRELIGGDYKYKTLGFADDLGTADGRDILTFDQARKLAGGAIAPMNGHLTVRGAIERYVKVLAGRSKHSKEAEQRADKWIMEPLGHIRVDRLTKSQVEDWLASMVRENTEDDSDAKRRSQDTANRTLTILKAALNQAFSDESNGIATDTAWRRVKPFRNVGAQRVDHFDAAQIKVLVAKASTFDKAYASLIEAAYLTGARLGELLALTIGDFDPKRATLTIRTGKTGARVVTLTTEAVAFFKRLTHDRPPAALLLPSTDGDAWKASEQHRPFKKAAELAELPASASFYSLRHSHISRAIEAGMPLSLVAEQCGTSLLMLQRNYAKVLASIRRETVQATSPKLRRVK